MPALAGTDAHRGAVREMAGPQTQPHTRDSEGGTSWSLPRQHQAPDSGPSAHRARLVLLQDSPSPASVLLSSAAGQLTGGSGHHEWWECGPALAAAQASQRRLLVSQDVELLLILGEETLETEVLPDDWQQLLQQLPLPQTHYC